MAIAIGGVAVSGAAAEAKPTQKPSARVERGELVVDGSSASDALVLRLAASSAERLQIDFEGDGRFDRTFARRRFDRITITTGDGADTVRIDETNGAFTDAEPTTIATGDGDDVVEGGSGDETVWAGGGNDLVDGGRGDDTAFLGAGDDRFSWDPGDGSDVVEGDDGDDTTVFNGSDDGERFELAPAGERVRFTRDIGSITTDLDGVEQLDLAAADGRDTIIAHDLTGTDLTGFSAGLEAAGGSPASDSQTDFLTLFGTEGADAVTVTGSAGVASISGLVPVVDIHGAALPDVMQVLGQGGDDTIDASGLADDAIGYGASGHGGADTLLGGAGADSLNGGDGDDVIDGGPSTDSVFMGAGDDRFQWQPGDGSDLVSGEDGDDVMTFRGSDDDEVLVAAADGFGGATFTRDVDGVTLQLDRLERIDVETLGGADSVLVDDLSDFRGTGLVSIDADLAGGADASSDTVTVAGSAEADTITVAGDPGTVTVDGLAAVVRVTTVEGSDVVTVTGHGGDDVIDATALVGTAAFVADGGQGDDALLGGDGGETFVGGDGADVVFAGSGNNVALGNAGDDVLRGEEGDDVLDGGEGEDILIGGAGDDVLLNGEVVFDD